MILALFPKKYAGKFFPAISSWLVDIVLVLELFNTSASVNELLLTCKERVALWANVKSDFFLEWLCNEWVAACASYFTFLIIWMDSFLHANYFLSCSAPKPLHNFCRPGFSMPSHSLYIVAHENGHFKPFLKNVQEKLNNLCWKRAAYFERTVAKFLCARATRAARFLILHFTVQGLR